MRALSGLALATVAAAAGCTVAPPTLTLSISAQPNVVAFRPDGGDWLEATVLDHATTHVLYSFPQVDGELVVACTQPNGAFQVEELFATADDFAGELYPTLLPWPQLDCTPPATTPNVFVTGSMLQGGQVVIGTQTLSGPNDWPFSAQIPSGVHDIIAIGQTSALIRHDQPMFTNFTVEPIDVDIGNKLLFVPISIAGMDEPSALEADILTVNGTRMVQSAFTDQLTLIPPQQLEPGDIEIARAGLIDTGNRQRSVAVLVNSGTVPPNIALADPGEDVVFSTTDVSVTFDQSSAMFTTARVAYASQAGSLAAAVTPAWLAAHPLSAIAFDPSFPEARWALDPQTARHQFTLAVRDGVVITSAVYPSDGEALTVRPGS